MKIIDVGDMACPRLELRWVDGDDPYMRICHYNLVVPGGKYDVRKGVGDEEVTMTLSTTRCRVVDAKHSHIFSDGSIEVPFRDGCHIGWDSLAMRLPAYVVVGSIAGVLEGERG